MSAADAATLTLDAFMAQCRERVQQTLMTQLEALPGPAARLRQAMLHASLLGGKRVRPVLAYASALAVGGRLEQADMAACAVELVHCYSLVHDDLPAMDDDDLRRGHPTVHIAFDDATAILAGDALQAMAFRLLSDPALNRTSPATSLHMINLLAAAGGFEGMVSGQAIDFEAVGRRLSLQDMQTMHSLKTGALIRASVQLGALAAEQASPARLTALAHYADCIGLAFQVQDDILDVVSDTATLGKTQGADLALNKPTYVSLLGLDAARAKAQDLCDAAHAALSEFDARADALRQIARYIVDRQH